MVAAGYDIEQGNVFARPQKRDAVIANEGRARRRIVSLRGNNLCRRPQSEVGSNETTASNSCLISLGLPLIM